MKARKRKYGLTVLMSCMVLIVGGFSASSILAQEKETITIGFIHSFTGPGAPYAEPCYNGALLRIDELNKKGGVLGKKIELIKRNDQCKPQLGLSIAKELVRDRKVDMLLGTVISSVGIAVAKYAENERIPFIITTSAAASLTESGFKYVTRPVTVNSTTQGRAPAMVAIKKGWKKIYSIAPDYAWGHEVADEFWEYLQSNSDKAQKVGESWPKLGTPDFGSYITAIMRSKPEALYCALFGSDLINFVKQAKAFGFYKNVVQFGPENAALGTVMAAGKDFQEGIIGSLTYPFYAAERPKALEFNKSYRDRTGKYPDGSAAQGYDCITAIAQAIEKAGSLKADDIMKAFSGLDVDSIHGSVRVRSCDLQGMVPDYWGTTKFVPEYPFVILTDIFSSDPAKTFHSCKEIEAKLARQ